MSDDSFEISEKDMKALYELLGRSPGAVYRLSDFTPKGKEKQRIKREFIDSLSDRLVGVVLDRGAADLLSGIIVDGMIQAFEKKAGDE